MYYNVDLNAVRAEISRNVFMGRSNEDKNGYAEREEWLRLLDEHIIRKQRKRPEHGDYDNPHAEKKIEGAFVDFERQTGRLDEKMDDDMEDQEGDVLILDPEKLKKRLPDIKFEKYAGRPEKIIDEEDDLEGDVLDLEPARPGKKLAEINFDKMVGRPDE